VHRFGRLARRLLDEARESVAGSVNTAPASLLFTSGGSEANDLAIAGSVAGGLRRLVVSAIEHPSVLATARAQGVECVEVDVGPDGVVGIEQLERLLAESETSTLVCVMLANNETGVVQPMRDVVALAHARGARVLCDAVQALGKLDIDFDGLGVDMMSLSGHKIGAPQGVGALVVRDGVELSPQLRGGGQEKGMRAGTENVPGIAGFGAAAQLVGERLAAMENVRALRDRLEAEVTAIAPGAVFYGAAAERLANTSNFSVPGLSAETQLIGLDLAGVAVSSGSACSSGKVHLSHVLGAMGVGEDLARNAIRVSLGWETAAADIDRFIAAWSALYLHVVGRARAKSA
jgi:cysteine desulfurase